MAFDPRIILAHQQYTGPDPHETMRTLSQLALQRTQQQHHQTTLAGLLEQRQQEQALRGIYAQNAQSPQALPSALMAGGFGKESLAVGDQFAETDKRRADMAKAIAEYQAQEQKRVGEAFYGVKDQGSWSAARSIVPEQFRHMIPETFDGSMAQRLANLAVPAERRAQFDATAANADSERTFRAGENEKDRRNRTTNASILAGQKDAANQADDTTGLRKEINSNKAVAKYRVASAELESLRELAKGKEGANDMALVFAFMKAMDPESVVREAEYAAAAATGSPDQRMMGLVSKWWTGGPLSPGQRQAFIKAAEAAQSGHKTAYQRAVKTYKHVAKKRKFDLAEIGLDDEGGESVGPHGATVTQNGHAYTWNPDAGAYE